MNEAKFGFNRGTADHHRHQSDRHCLMSFAVSGFTTLNNNRMSTGIGNSFSEIDNLHG